MKTRNIFVWAALLLILAGFTAKPAHAQKPANLYGSAYIAWGAAGPFGPPPGAIPRVYLWDDTGRIRGSVDTNSIGLWQLRNVPSNRWYNFQSVCYGYRSPVVRYYVAEPWSSYPIWTLVPDLACR